VCEGEGKDEKVRGCANRGAGSGCNVSQFSFGRVLWRCQLSLVRVHGPGELLLRETTMSYRDEDLPAGRL
jgi:hypothetical protein